MRTTNTPYNCNEKFPRHMTVNITDGPTRMSFGGVSQIPPSVFEKLNGYSNQFWGWGGEDDQMYWRIKKMLKLPISEPKLKDCLFDMLEHQVHGEYLNQPNPRAVKEIKNYKFYKSEGLSNLRYERQRLSDCKIFAHVLADLKAPKNMPRRG